ncbi:MAG: hypothetical protein NTW04_01490, partial [Elusimicrobia bacterium]|nr:hypothetical protein [Elusimicrobiota bacterium]
RNIFSPESKTRIIDILSDEIRSLRNLTDQREEYWLREAAGAFFFGDKPLYLAVKSPFTELFYFERLRWMFESPDKKTMAQIKAALANIRLAARRGEKNLADAIKNLPPEMAEQFVFNINHLPPETLADDVCFMADTISHDLEVGHVAVVSAIKRVLENIISRRNLRIAITAGGVNSATAVKCAGGLAKKLPLHGEADGKPVFGDAVISRLKSRYPDVKNFTHAGLVNQNTKSGAFVISAPGISYKSGDPLDFLSAKALSGGGPHSIFTKTWEAGLAYSNGANANPSSGKLNYYAERCPSLVETISFVSGVARNFKPDNYICQYALANSFSDYRGAEDMSSRGYGMYCDLADGIRPEVVKKFKRKLIALGAKKSAAKQIGARAKKVLGKIIPGVDGKLSSAGAKAFVCGPLELLKKYEEYLKKLGETKKLILLYPRDFWLV